MVLNKFIIKVICGAILIILTLRTRTFFAFSYSKNGFKNISFYTTSNNFHVINSSLSSEEDLIYEKYNTFLHKKLDLFLLDKYITKKNLAYSKDLLSFFPLNEDSQLHFHGYAEYAHFLTVNKVDFTTSKATITLTGSMMDGYNLDKSQINIKYNIDNSSVNEYIIVNHEGESKDTKHTLSSIISNQTILKLPLKVNNSWEQKFFYNGIEHEATTTITSVKNINNLKQCTTVTIVDNIDGYLNNTYTEEKTYEEGKGLIFFSVSTPLDGSFPYIVFENNTFSYILDEFIEKK